MAIQPDSPNSYLDNRIAAMQQQIKGLPTQKDQQELIASQKATAASLEQLAVILKEQSANKEIISKLEEYRKAKELDNEAITELIQIVKDAKEAYEIQTDTQEKIQEAFSEYVSNNKDAAIRMRIQQDSNSSILDVLNKTLANLGTSQEQALFKKEDEERQKGKIRDAIVSKFEGFAKSIIGYLDNLWNRFKPGWEDFFKVVWALFAPHLLNAIKWTVEHINEIGHFKFILDHIKTIASWGGKILKFAGNLTKGIISAPGKLITAFKGTNTFKQLSELPKVLKNLDVVQKIKAFKYNVLKAIQESKAYKNVTEALNAVKAFIDGKMQKVAEFLTNTKGKIVEFGTKVAQSISDVVKSFSEGISQAVKSLKEGISKFGANLSKITRPLRAAFDEARLQFHYAMMDLKTGIGEVTKWFHNNTFAKSGRQLNKWFSGLGNAIKADLKPAMDVVGKSFGKIGKFVSDVFSKLKPATDATIKAIGKVAPAAGGFMKALRAVGKVFGPLMIVIDAIVGFLRTETTATGLKGFLDRLRGAIANVINGFVQLVGLIWNLAITGLSKIPGIGDWFKDKKMTDQGKANFSAHLLGMNAYSADDGKIHYETLASQKEREGNGYSPVSDWGYGGAQLSQVYASPQELGNQLATASEQTVKGNTNPGGWCLKKVTDAMELAGHKNMARLASAYMYGPYLASRDDFMEVKGYSPAQLKSLPRGAVVVWGKGTTKHGHISIADGHGRELSDYVGAQRIKTSRSDGLHYGLPRVFMPVKSSGVAGKYDLNEGIDPSLEDSGATVASADISLEGEQQQQYTMANAIMDIMKLSEKVGSSNAADAIYSKAEASSSHSTPSQPAPIIAMNEPITYSQPQINDRDLIQQQMPQPLT